MQKNSKYAVTTILKVCHSYQITKNDIFDICVMAKGSTSRIQILKLIRIRSMVSNHKPGIILVC